MQVRAEIIIWNRRLHCSVMSETVSFRRDNNGNTVIVTFHRPAMSLCQEASSATDWIGHRRSGLTDIAGGAIIDGCSIKPSSVSWHRFYSGNFRAVAYRLAILMVVFFDVQKLLARCFSVGKMRWPSSLHDGRQNQTSLLAWPSMLWRDKTCMKKQAGLLLSQRCVKNIWLNEPWLYELLAVKREKQSAASEIIVLPKGKQNQLVVASN